MKYSNYIKIVLLGSLLFAFNYVKAQLIPSTTPITVNTTPVIQTCNLGSFGNAQISVPTESLTGDNILLNITFPATAVGCVKKVNVTNSANLNFVSSVIPFVPAGTNIYTNSAVLDPINGQNFNVIYKFPTGVTCNNATGNFTVVFEVDCGGTITTCTATVSVRARAANYWSINKVFVNGDLVCGNSYWRIQLTNNNPNPGGLGGYNISGTFTETVTSVPIISPTGPTSIGSLPSNYNATWTVGNVTLQNCQTAGTTITNTANYNLTLGGSCSVVTGTISATSTPLQSPNASINFTKYAWANGGIFSTGCQGYYVIAICNNGNVPWSGFTLTDNLSIPGITVTSFTSSGGWVASPGTLTGMTTFTNPGLVLLPGQCTYIYLYFNITGPTSSTVTNTATLNYAGYVASGSGSGGSSTACVGISCPTISTAPQTKTATNTFTISAPKAVPSIVKCNEPNPYIVPIKQVGNLIKFRIQVGNSGAATLNTVVEDVLNSSPQNLILSGVPTFTYYANQNGNYCGGLSGTGVPYLPTPSNIGTATQPKWNLSIPPNCNLWKANVVVIEFDAYINPQLSGSRTNVATATTGTSTISGSAPYTIDKTGELKIRKIADVATVENGAGFNYILTVTNMGSTPLNNIVVTDNLPQCVQLNGTVVVKKLSTTIPSSVSGGIVITVSPTAVLNPGESFVITVPVKKVSGTNCCNPLATATAKMVPDGTLINATTPVTEPACVTSTTCCDIEKFQVSLNASPVKPGQFNMVINAGSIPVQEMEVSMLDYHVTYSNPDCKPLNMGIFGNIFSPNTTIGGLTLNNNNAQSIDWGLGTPTLLNTGVTLVISKPGISNLNCCNGRMYFCLKIRIKNADCQVCEKIVCGSFNLKSNIIIWNPDKDVLTPMPYSIRPELKDVNDKAVLDQQQMSDIEDAKIQAAIESELKKLAPEKAQEFLKRLNANPAEVIRELKAKMQGGTLAAPTGGTTPGRKEK